MIIELFGWLCTGLVLLGYLLNANQYYKSALITWLIGDLGWIIYDLYIDNISHLALCVAVIAINSFGIFKIIKEKLYINKK